jgi:hypothetical protein
MFCRLLYMKGAIIASHYKSGNIIPVLSSFVGCPTFIPSSRYVDPACVPSPGMTELTFVLGVDVSFCIGFSTGYSNSAGQFTISYGSACRFLTVSYSPSFYTRLSREGEEYGSWMWLFVTVCRAKWYLEHWVSWSVAGTMIYFSYEPFSLFTDKTLTMPNRVLFTINPANMFNLRVCQGLHLLVIW